MAVKRRKPEVPSFYRSKVMVNYSIKQYIYEKCFSFYFDLVSIVKPDFESVYNYSYLIYKLSYEI